MPSENPVRDLKILMLQQSELTMGKLLSHNNWQGMGIPVGKLALYTALGGIRPSSVCDLFHELWSFPNVWKKWELCFLSSLYWTWFLKGAESAWIVVTVWLSLKIEFILGALLCIADTSSGNWCGHQHRVASQQSFLHWTASEACNWQGVLSLLFSSFFFTPLDSLAVRHSDLLHIDLVSSWWFSFLRNTMNCFMSLCQLWSKHMEKKCLSRWVLTQPPLIEIHTYDCVYLRASMLSFNQVLCIVLSVVIS